MNRSIPNLPTAAGSKASGHTDSPLSPILDHTNPGATAPSRQQFARPTIDQAMTVTMATTALRNSNGEMQRKDVAPGQQGIGVTSGSSAGPSVSGDSMKSGAKNNTDQGTLVELGRSSLAANVFPGDQNVSRLIKDLAERLPILGDNYDGGAASLKGVPKTINIR